MEQLKQEILSLWQGIGFDALNAYGGDMTGAEVASTVFTQLHSGGHKNHLSPEASVEWEKLDFETQVALVQDLFPANEIFGY